MQDDRERKIGAKIPSWKGMELPSSLSYEQCSSEKTAAYKLRFVQQGDVVADLTGGLGVDTAAFASKASEVHYFEQNPELFAAVQRNFSKMPLVHAEGEQPIGKTATLASRVEMRNETVSLDTDIPQCDLIYMDPARRSTAGKKVFLLEDCTPNVLELLPMLWRHTRRILLKLSPMADISLVTGRLSEANSSIEGVGKAVMEVHVVELGGEVKELLIYMVRGFEGRVQITATDTLSAFTFDPEEEKNAAPVLAMPKVGERIFVPSGAVLKAGAFNSLGLPRLSLHSHLYLFRPGTAQACEDSVPGRKYGIEEILPMTSKTIRQLAGKYPKADVSCHDVPLRSEEMASRLKCKSGGDHHIFASSSAEGNVIIVCSKEKKSE